MKRWLAIAFAVILVVGVGWLFYFKTYATIGQTAQGSMFYGWYDVGLRLSGTEVQTATNDFSWTDTHRWVQIETKPWYKIPYHVTVDFARDINDNAIYLHSSYGAPRPGYTDVRQDFGAARAWNRHLMADPHMRFKLMGDEQNRIYRATARLITDPAEYEKARQAFHVKVLGQGTGTCAPAGTDPPPCGLEQQPAERRSRTYYFRITPDFS